ncbi:MAG: hypothetical protein R3E68_15900 [Burkholderiaceae bacterium]
MLRPLPGEASLFDRVLAEKNTASFLARYYRRPADKVAVYVGRTRSTPPPRPGSTRTCSPRSCRSNPA